MKYAEALEYLNELSQSRMAETDGKVQDDLSGILEKLGNPERKLPIIRITGNKGKSSVIRILSSIFAAAGYKTGSYETKYLQEEREKFRINGKMMAKQELGRYLEQVLAAGATGIQTERMLALHWAADKKCDMLLLEGEGIETAEKEFVFDMEIIWETRAADPVSVRTGLEKQRFGWNGYKNLMLPLAGNCQIENAVCALETLKKLPFRVSEEQIREGLLRVECPGRFQMKGRKPCVVMDNVTDGESAKRFQESMRNYFTNKRILYIIGMLEDASGDEILKTISQDADMIITTSFPGNSCYHSPLKLAEHVCRYNQNVTALDSPEEAMEMAGLLTDKDSVLAVLGPLPLLGWMDRIMEERDRSRDVHGIVPED